MMSIKYFGAGLLIGAFCSAAMGMEDVRVPWKPIRVQQFSEQAASGELPAKMAKPAKLPAPFVVFMHGCGGLKLDAVGHWVDFFVKQGVGVLLVDSLTPRGRDEACSDTGPEWARRRADDAAAAVSWLKSQPDVRTDRIALMGQSQGATAAMLAAQRQAASSRDIVGAIAMYPGCGFGVNAKFQFDKPLLIMVGGDDTWNPAAPCETLKAAQSDLQTIELTVFPGASHSFDNPGPSRMALGKYPVGEHAASRDKARTLVTHFVEQRLR